MRLASTRCSEKPAEQCRGALCAPPRRLGSEIDNYPGLNYRFDRFRRDRLDGMAADVPTHVKCVACGHEITTTKAYLDAREVYVCEGCGRSFNLDDDEDDDLKVEYEDPEILWYLAPMLTCHCGKMIELPYSDLPLTDQEGVTLVGGEDPPELPSEEWSAVFGCTECGRISIYVASQVKTHPIPKLTEGIYQSGKGVYHAEFPCGDKRCIVPALMYVDAGVRSASEVVPLLRSGLFDGKQLSCGHQMKTVPEPFYRVVPVLRRLW